MRYEATRSMFGPGRRRLPMRPSVRGYVQVGAVAHMQRKELDVTFIGSPCAQASITAAATAMHHMLVVLYTLSRVSVPGRSPDVGHNRRRCIYYSRPSRTNLCGFWLWYPQHDPHLGHISSVSCV